jgi:hypothetical protein
MTHAACYSSHFTVDIQLLFIGYNILPLNCVMCNQQHNVRKPQKLLIWYTFWFITSKWNEIEQRSGEVWDQFIHEKNYATLQNKNLPPILINKLLYYPRWHMLCLVTWEPFLYWALTPDCISWTGFKIYLQLFGSGLVQMPGFPGQKLCTLRFCMASRMGPAASMVWQWQKYECMMWCGACLGRWGFVYVRKHQR